MYYIYIYIYIYIKKSKNCKKKQCACAVDEGDSTKEFVVELGKKKLFNIDFCFRSAEAILNADENRTTPFTSSKRTKKITEIRRNI